jgi:RNA polymerase sigma-70 factor (ECF subfamily)
MPTTDLVELARGGDTAAFEALVRAGSNRLYAIAYRILRDADLAEDALQTALVQMWDDLPALRDTSCFEAWSCRLVCRCCYRVAQHERRRHLLPLNVDAPSVGPDPAAGIAERDEMEHAFRHLALDHRTALVLHYHLGLTIGEIADVLGVPPGTVGSRLHYALRALREALRQEAGTPAWERST